MSEYVPLLGGCRYLLSLFGLLGVNGLLYVATSLMDPGQPQMCVDACPCAGHSEPRSNKRRDVCVGVGW